ncbi:MAG: DUF1326 domain-containing protein [Acidimicrobiales bacterium]
MSAAVSVPVDWRARGSYFEGCNCEAICPCRSVRGAPGGPSTYGECYGALSWHVHEGHADGIDLADRLVVMTLRYYDKVQPSTRWDVVLYVDDRADDAQAEALAAIFLGRAGGTVADQYGRAIGEVHAVRRAHITVEHVKVRKRIAVAGYITVEAEEPASEPGEVACGIPGLDRPGIELFNDIARSDDPLLRWEVRGRGASFASDFDYRS